MKKKTIAFLRVLILIVIGLTFSSCRNTTSANNEVNEIETYSPKNLENVGDLHNYLLNLHHEQKSISITFSDDGLIKYEAMSLFLANIDEALVALGYDKNITSAVVQELDMFFGTSSIITIKDGIKYVNLLDNDFMTSLWSNIGNLESCDPIVYEKINPIVEMYLNNVDPLYIEQAVLELNQNLQLYSEETTKKILDFVSVYEASGVYWANYGASPSIRISATLMDGLGTFVGGCIGGALGQIIAGPGGAIVGGSAGGAAGGAFVSEVHAQFEKWVEEQEEEKV